MYKARNSERIENQRARKAKKEKKMAEKEERKRKRALKLSKKKLGKKKRRQCGGNKDLAVQVKNKRIKTEFDLGVIKDDPVDEKIHG